MAILHDRRAVFFPCLRNHVSAIQGAPMHASRFTALLSRAAVVAAVVSSALFSPAQNSMLQQRIQEIKQSTAANKKALARYTWEEQQTISLKGEVKKIQTFLVR